MTPMTMTVMTVGHLFFFKRLQGVLFIKSNYLNINNNLYNFVNDGKNRLVSSLSSSSSVIEIVDCLFLILVDSFCSIS